MNHNPWAASDLFHAPTYQVSRFAWLWDTVTVPALLVALAALPTPLRVAPQPNNPTTTERAELLARLARAHHHATTNPTLVDNDVWPVLVNALTYTIRAGRIVNALDKRPHQYTPRVGAILDPLLDGAAARIRAVTAFCAVQPEDVLPDTVRELTV